MKVVVRCAHNRVTKADMEREIERLFQENKDLKLSESHLRLEVSILRQQSEARRQVICERDKLIQELNEEVQASNDELENVQCDLVDHVKLQEEMCDTIDDLRIKVANACADRDNFEASYKQVLQWWEAAQSKVVKAEAAADEYRIAAMESDCRVNELEKQLEWVRDKNDEWAAVAQGLRNTIEEMKVQKEADDKKSEEICTACNERYEDVLAERNRLREEVARLTTERDTSVSENSELIFTINELQDKLEVERNLRTNAEKERDMYRSSAEAWHAEHDKVVADVALYREKARKYLDERNRAWDTNGRLEGNEETITYYQEIAEKRKEKLNEAMRTITSLNDDIHELEETIDGLNEDKRAYGEEIDRLRKVVTNLQSTRFTTDEFIGMIVRELMPSTGNSFADSVDF